MAKNVFDPSVTYNVFLNIRFPGFACGMSLPGHFEADSVEAFDESTQEREFGVFTVDEPTGNEYPHRFVGTYRIPFGELKTYNPELFVVPEPEPEPEPADPDDPSEPADQENGEPVE